MWGRQRFGYAVHAFKIKAHEDEGANDALARRRYARTAQCVWYGGNRFSS
jgi:hypothetical protein